MGLFSKTYVAPPLKAEIKWNEMRIDMGKCSVVIAQDSNSRALAIWVDGELIENVESVEYKWVTADDSTESKMHLIIVYFDSPKIWASNQPLKTKPERMERVVKTKGSAKEYESQIDKVMRYNDEARGE